MKIFLTGATGYIGTEVACELRRHGHQVYGLVRSLDKAQYVIRNEVTPVVGDLHKLQEHRDLIRQCDAFIHCATDRNDIANTEIKVVDFVLSLDFTTRKPLFIYTSGVLVYPSSTNMISDESTKLEKLPGFLASRAEQETRVLNSDKVTGVVVRPGFVFGKNSEAFCKYFAQATSVGTGPLKVKLANVLWSQIHVDDVANGYAYIVEAPRNLVRGEIFNFTDGCRMTNLEVVKRLALAAGYNGSVVEDPDMTQVWPEMNRSVLVDSSKATRLLGWTPRHRLQIDETEVYYKQWKLMKDNNSRR